MESAAKTGVYCLAAMLRHHRFDHTPEGLAATYALGKEPVRPAQMLRMARESGLRAREVTLGRKGLLRIGQALPALVRLANGNWICIVAVVQGETAQKASLLQIYDPLAPAGNCEIPLDTFCEKWDGTAILAKRSYALAEPDQPFSLRWFVPEILRQRKLFRDVAVAAVFLYALGLATPMFFQLVIDKVLVHQSYSTLAMLSVGVVIALLFDAIFGFLRRYLLLFATNRIDIRTATRTFAHLMSLPMSYFEQSSAGVIVKHMQQTGRIREFLTGRLFLTLLDSASLFVFLPVLFLYSAPLALTVLGFGALMALVVGALIGPFRRRLRALYEAEAQRQSLLVESVHGMRTLKALAMEPLQRRIWDDRSARSISTRFEVERISAFAQTLTGFTEKLMSVAIVGFGALAVFRGDMTVGALVAFNMLAGRVSGPLSQIVTMVHEYQEVGLSIRMLGEIMNQPAERPPASRGLCPSLGGAIEFEDVSFRYRTDLPMALDRISFTVPAGGILGVVGRSGSGKTTITRLLQGLYPVQEGTVRVGGHDLREVDLNHLRRSVGVVLQENFLFRGTVRENVAAARPDATFEQIYAAAKLAGADEFIERLPRGFDTLIEENGENLSGGQRQRISIARALITDPKLLILDEATSALDPESEAIIRRSIRAIARGRTVIIVSHRLSTLTDAQAILVIEAGQLADCGSHDQLLGRCASYRQLWNQQMSLAG